MRRITFWSSSKALNHDFYNACLDLTPLVEPSGNRAVYLDLTGCKIKRGQIKKLTSYSDAHIRIGMAASRLVAHAAAVTTCLPSPTRPKTYQLHRWANGEMIEIFPQRDPAFLGSLPLECFPSLDQSQLKKLRRSGFNYVEEIANLPPYELVRLLGEKGLLISEQARGIDPSPVMGLYPPSRIFYQLNFASELDNECSLQQILKQAATQLAAQLRQKNSTCQQISLELHQDSHKDQAERCLQMGSQDERLLEHVFERLAKHIMNAPDQEYQISGLTITLNQLVPLSWSQPDLFSQRFVSTPREEKARLDQALLRLEERFPGFLTRGIPIARREQVLSLWDPWRSYNHE